MYSSFRENPFLKEAKLRDIPKPETLEKKFRGKICQDGLHVLKSLLEMDPERRCSADTILSHSFFDEVRDQPIKEPSPRGGQVKRVHSSTYRTAKYGTLEGEEDFEGGKRYPSHSQERSSYMRATGMFGTQDLRLLDTNESRLSVNNKDEHFVMGEKKKSFASTRTGGFMIKDSQVANPRKEASNQSRREEREPKNDQNDSRGFVNPQNNGRRKVLDPKKSVSNFKMFRIRRPAVTLGEEIEYENSRRNPGPQVKGRKRGDEFDSTLQAGFLPHIPQTTLGLPHSKRGDFQSIYGSLTKPSHKYDRKPSKPSGTTFFLVGK
jgi:hypothetical protein